MFLRFSTGVLADWCSRCPWATVGIWTMILLIATGFMATLLGDVLTTEMAFTNNPESKKGSNLIEERMYISGQLEEVTEVVLVSSSELTVDSPDFEQFVRHIFDRATSPDSETPFSGTHYYLSGDESLVSLDRHTAGLAFVFEPTTANYEAFFDSFTAVEGEIHSKGFEVRSFRAERGSKAEVVIVQSSALTVDQPQYRQFVEDLFLDILSLGRGVVWSGVNYYVSGEESLVSADSHATIIPLAINEDEVDRILNVIDEARANSEFGIFITGNATVDRDFEQISEEDLRNGELLFGMPIAVMVLILVFGALVAAFVPLMMALVSIAIALGMASLIGQTFDLSVFLVNMVFTVGLAVGIDYSLFIIDRFREERALGKEKHEAITVAGATAGQAMLFSGMTVIFALIGLLFVPLTLFLSLGVGAILVVIVSVGASLTLLPAVLSLLGDRINALRVPFVMKNQTDVDGKGAPGFWDRVSGVVMRFPVLSVAVCLVILGAAISPVFGMKVGATEVSTFPDNFESKKGYLALEQNFSAGLVSEATIVIDGSADDPSVRAGIDRLKAALSEDSSFGDLTEKVNQQRDLLSLATPISGGDQSSPDALSALKRLRGDYIPHAFSDTPVQVFVTGGTAEYLDYINASNDTMPFVFSFVLIMSFVILMMVFRSIVIPLKAILMNLLSVGAAYGLIVLLFVDGVGNEIFGFQQVDRVEAWVPVFLFAVLFGLSMDYHVFLLSRIRERFVQSGRNAESVAYGLRSTGRLITGAALIMVAVFSGFASGDLVMFQQMGFGLAVSIFLDATLIRSVLVPASMKLLGGWNWYLPGWLGWLPRISVEGD